MPNAICVLREASNCPVSFAGRSEEQGRHTWRATGRTAAKSGVRGGLPPPADRIAGRAITAVSHHSRRVPIGRDGRQPRPHDGGDASERSGPPLPASIEARQLAPDVRGELITLDKATADYVARHLVAAGELLDDDPEAALEHAKAARNRAARIAAVREAVGIAAYRCGDWAQALAELRAARRMGSKSVLLPMIADCERGVGRPERAIELGKSPEAAQLTGDDADELRIVVAGARSDLGQNEQALAILSTPQLDPDADGPDGRPALLRLCRDAARVGAQARGAAVVHQRRRLRPRGRDRRRRAHHGAVLT